MDEESRKQGLQLLKELVLDAGEPVSYRRLASALCVHVNRSKALMQEFIDKNEEKNDLNVSVLLCGMTGDRNARTILCLKDELNVAKKSLKSIIFEHIYAVSKSRTGLEGTALMAAGGSFEDFTPTIGAISSAVCTKHSYKEIDELKINTYKSLNDQNREPISTKSLLKESKISQNLVVPKVKQNDSNEIDNSNPENFLQSDVFATNGPTKVTKALKPTEKNNISSFFTKSNGKQNMPTMANVKEESDDHKLKPSEESKLKHSEECKVKLSEEHKLKPTENIKPKLEPVTPNQEKSKSSKTHSTESKKKCDEKKIVPKKTGDNKEKEDIKKSKSKRNEIISSQRNGKIDKKRKRVLLVSDSEESDNDKEDPFKDPPSNDINIESDEDVIPSTPNADIVKITSGIINPKKRRKIVDKTYTTEDGYMVTRKEEIFESCSEDEVEMKENKVIANVKEEKEIVVKKPPAPTPKSKKKMPSPQKGKQASIMNFFKKK